MPTESNFPPLGPALLKLVSVLSRAAVESTQEWGHAIRENPPLLGKLLLKALPGVGFAPAAIDTRKTFEDWRRFREWDESREEKDDSCMELRATKAGEALVKGAQTALLTGSAFAYAIAMNLHRHHPVLSIPFFAAGLGTQAASVLFLEAETIPDVIATRCVIGAVLDGAARARPSQAPTAHEPRIPFKE